MNYSLWIVIPSEEGKALHGAGRMSVTRLSTETRDVSIE